MIRSALRAVIARAKAGLEDLAAASLLEEASEVLEEVRAPHWSGEGIAAVPDMIRELARDRDDYRSMAESYRKQLADSEDELEYQTGQAEMHANLRRENLDMYLAELERLMKENHQLRARSCDPEDLDELTDE